MHTLAAMILFAARDSAALPCSVTFSILNWFLLSICTTTYEFLTITPCSFHHQLWHCIMSPFHFKTPLLNACIVFLGACVFQNSLRSHLQNSPRIARSNSTGAAFRSRNLRLWQQPPQRATLPIVPLAQFPRAPWCMRVPNPKMLCWTCKVSESLIAQIAP